MIHLFPPASKSLHRIADNQYQKVHEFARYRGTIFDRRREPLAISIRTPSYFINPKIFNPNKPKIRLLAKHLHVSVQEVRQAAAKKHRYFQWLKRRVSNDAADRIEKLDISGLYMVMEPARFYPSGSSAANILGYVGIDDQGLMGLERQYGKPLGGLPIKYLQSKDAKGRTLFLQADQAAPHKAGNNIVLTLDRAVQEIAEVALKQGIERAKAKGGFAIVADPHTGKLLAVANYPTFDPNDRHNIDLARTKNQAFMNGFEPGSVVKPLVVAGGLMDQVIELGEKFDCQDGSIRIGKHTIRDSHKPESRWQTVEEIVRHSSNVGTYAIAKRLGKEGLYKTFHSFGLGARKFRLGFPGEASGWMDSWMNWREIRFANIAFGQGLMVTGLDLIAAFSAIANGGNLMKPYLLEKIESSDGKTLQSSEPQTIGKAITPNIAKKIRKILFDTVELGVKKARLDLWTAGGKTGTPQKIDPLTKAYSDKAHYATFIGIAPASDPHLVIYVQIDEPDQPVSYGSLWAAPVFAHISERTLHYLNVAPDRDMTISRLGGNQDEQKL